METIKIEVSVELNLSNDAKTFIASLFNAALAPAAQVPTPRPEVKIPTSKPAAPAAPAAPEISIDDVRKALAAKVNDFRSDIKAKLEELGAQSVTKLNPAKYGEMLDFLNNLGK